MNHEKKHKHRALDDRIEIQVKVSEGSGSYSALATI